jgi:4-hydroxy-3-methylbut-2-enyl diphosphate reductase
MKNFSVPPFYRSEKIAGIKAARTAADPKRRDPSPTVIELPGGLTFKVARHFGFCYGVENAIDIAYRAIEENPGRRIFLLSEMIHNPEVNEDLISRGVKFLMTTSGEVSIPFSELTPDDIVIVPAFGTTLEIQQALKERGIDPYFYDTTCPFVQKVWKRSAELGRDSYTVIIHGKPRHEETRATFSHSSSGSPSLIVRDMKETKILIGFIEGILSLDEFWKTFRDQVSEGFDPVRDLQRIGVVNQTTMLATETQAIAEELKQAMIRRYGADADRFADTRDTLCYATYENQTATSALTDSGADLAIVVGGYNSSNTSHLVELCQERMPTYFVRNDSEILSADKIRHFDLTLHKEIVSENWLPTRRPLTVAVTSGASCPDRVVEGVMRRVAELAGAEF